MSAASFSQFDKNFCCLRGTLLAELLWGALGLLWGALEFLWGALGLLLGSFGVPLGSFGVPLGSFWGALGLLLGCPWVPFGVPLGSLWPASGSPVPGEVASSQVPRIATRSAFFELISGISGIPGIRGSGVIQCCSEPPFHTHPGARMT